MKRIAVIEGSYVRDTQVYNDDPMYINQDPNWNDNFGDVYKPCQYVGVFEGIDGYEIRCKAAKDFGVHPDIISLIPLETKEDETADMVMFEFDCLKDHVGHQIEIVTYGGDWNVAIECVDCCQVLYSVNNPKSMVSGMNRPTIENRVFYRGSRVPLMPKQLAIEAGFNFQEPDYPARISGRHCDCAAGGEFELLPKDDPAVVEGQKRYMQCRICGGWSHL